MLKSRIPQITARLQVTVEIAIREAAEEIVAEAKARVPVASGTLRDSIHTEPADDGVLVVAGDRDAFYGHLVEFGTTQAPAQPFLIPALESRKGAVIKRTSAALRGL